MTVVSGIGLVTPLGSQREKTWANLIAGRSAIAPAGDHLEARVVDFSLNGARSRMGDFALLAAQEALLHAGLTIEQAQQLSVGCVIGQSKPIISSPVQGEVGRRPGGGKHGPSPPTPSLKGRGGLSPDPSLLLGSFTGWSASDVVKREFQLSGPSTNVVAACATGVAALETAAQWIELGLCDVALAGASESSLGDFYRAGFQQMGVLAGGSAENVRPFDTSRSGFAMGEGAAVMVLESEERARARGHAPLARLEKITLRHNPEDIISFDESGVHVERLIRATVNKTRPGYVNAHGTGTRLNDLVEARGLARAFGDDVAHIPVSSTKAATGHLLGAAGAVEAALCVLALRDGKIPPTVHLTDPDPACAFDAVRGGARSQKIDSALSLSYGFGGQMGAVLFSRV